MAVAMTRYRQPLTGYVGIFHHARPAVIHPPTIDCVRVTSTPVWPLLVMGRNSMSTNQPQNTAHADCSYSPSEPQTRGKTGRRQRPVQTRLSRTYRLRTATLARSCQQGMSSQSPRSDCQLLWNRTELRILDQTGSTVGQAVGRGKRIRATLSAEYAKSLLRGRIEGDELEGSAANLCEHLVYNVGSCPAFPGCYSSVLLLCLLQKSWRGRGSSY